MHAVQVEKLHRARPTSTHIGIRILKFECLCGCNREVYLHTLAHLSVTTQYSQVSFRGIGSTSSAQRSPQLQEIRQRCEGAELIQRHVETFAVIRGQPREQSYKIIRAIITIEMQINVTDTYMKRICGYERPVSCLHTDHSPGLSVLRPNDRPNRPRGEELAQHIHFLLPRRLSHCEKERMHT